ncbi:MAG: Ribonuclease D [Candidatus Midichloria mitochondrii]|uniref:Ribonuclease D n=1 Tax=Midichloria mitochondrii (strain IricVA) TaxID=696127 RepID=F7XTT5_MIDMI|nr:3'-5' exonuclease [Candidatus Midichloria mitochondrii]AEI89294.1 ribonuclease D [Candidatus Midichloria mitochondrii IricVA]MDJ1256381.1 ribonuclease D [Candidatus Midichloria mitochondrii]MDJ1288073.1 ribonuclease D [Candidatus Midichloria mitochondrii]MDJ1298911.1 ribonuclease D [Candidatus Midichloria mitochondrii]MDJ1313062.1 ribonuclease D [Candidatus Midichloria mitochondrii]
MQFFYHKYDLPKDVEFPDDIAIDCEAMGLNILRDRLCVVQISAGNGTAHLVHFPSAEYAAPNLKKVLSNEKTVKIFHFARFDLAIINHYLSIKLKNIYCTKIASRLSRTYTDAHSLRELCSELLEVKISKQQQCSDWGSKELTQQQIEYAGSDVLYLHSLRRALNEMLVRENRKDLAQQCFDFLPTRAVLDLLGWNGADIFAHH